jgi:predicted O-methyltransferase YrrM
VAFNNALPTGTAPDDDVFDLAQHVRSDDRLVPVLVPLGDGLLAAVKRGD